MRGSGDCLSHALVAERTAQKTANLIKCERGKVRRDIPSIGESMVCYISIAWGKYLTLYQCHLTFQPAHDHHTRQVGDH